MAYVEFSSGLKLTLTTIILYVLEQILPNKGLTQIFFFFGLIFVISCKISLSKAVQKSPENYVEAGTLVSGWLDLHRP